MVEMESEGAIEEIWVKGEEGAELSSKKSTDWDQVEKLLGWAVWLKVLFSNLHFDRVEFVVKISSLCGK